jgi:hypothetical protein
MRRRVAAREKAAGGGVGVRGGAHPERRVGRCGSGRMHASAGRQARARREGAGTARQSKLPSGVWLRARNGGAAGRAWRESWEARAQALPGWPAGRHGGRAASGAWRAVPCSPRARGAHGGRRGGRSPVRKLRRLAHEAAAQRARGGRSRPADAEETAAGCAQPGRGGDTRRGAARWQNGSVLDSPARRCARIARNSSPLHAQHRAYCACSRCGVEKYRNGPHAASSATDESGGECSEKAKRAATSNARCAGQTAGRIASAAAASQGDAH